MHRYVTNVKSAWKINIQLFTIFSYQLLINGMFGVTPNCATCYYRTFVMI